MGILSKSTHEPEVLPLDQHPAVAAARSKLYELHHERDAISAKLSDAQIAKTARDKMDAEVDLLLADTPEAIATAQAVTAIDGTIAQLRRDQSVHLRAIERQKARVAEAETAATLDIRKAYLERHKASGRRVAQSLKQLQGVLAEARDLRLEIEACGVSISYPLQDHTFYRAGEHLSEKPGEFFFIDAWLKEHSNYIYDGAVE